LVRLIILSAFVLGFSLIARCQQNDLALLVKTTAEKAASSDAPDEQEKTSHKSLRFPTRIFFGFYRNTLSEQFSADCAYDLSCSRFSIHSIRQFGILKGGLLTADRLTRCGHFAAKYTVPIFNNARTGKVIDEPSMY
jgi:uncharacterized protein